MSAGLMSAGLIGLLWVVYLRRVPHLDLDVFLQAGNAVRHGLDPYPPPGAAEVYSGHSFVYPYPVAWLFVPLSLLPGGAAAAVFITGSAAAVVAGCRLLGVRSVAVCGLVLVMSTTIVGLQMGTLNALLFCGVAALWRFRDRPWIAAAVLTALTVSKLFLAPLWLWLLFTRRTRAAGLAAAGIGAVLGLGWLTGPLGPSSYGSLLSLLGTHEAAAGLSPTGLLINLGLGAALAQNIARLAAAALILAAAVRARAGADRARAGADERVLMAACLVAALVASPVVWNHYLILLVVPLLIGARTEESQRLVVVLAAACSWLIVTPHATDALRASIGGCLLLLLAACAFRSSVLRSPGRAGRPTPRAAGDAGVATRLGSTRLGSTRLGSTRLGSTRLAATRTGLAAGAAAAAFGVVEALGTAQGHGGPIVGAGFAVMAMAAVVAFVWSAPPAAGARTAAGAVESSGGQGSHSVSAGSTVGESGPPQRP